ncbi:hypothetical protein GCM10010123_34260 [Pilimelia anulata]|uniref:Uncharacterized protein n=1 Tax=Pilimelia anulata TaxID=53371 RepID=A0A8J3B877_9ACTN|nr:hypothetical protein [Pilimelia anulata]GGK01537.1 hypothetical protein GCM10010123_34260 [Pilimelia anulata]
MIKSTGSAAVAAAVALAGCASCSLSTGSDFFDRAVVPHSEVKLGDAVMAFFVGPQNSEMFTPIGEVHEPGYLILVNGDGSFRAVRTKRMDMMRPAWSDHGLYFTDESSDYHLTAAGLRKTDNPKTTAQNLMFALPAGGAVGVHNGGGDSDRGYNNQVAAITADGSRLHDVQGNYFTGALCGGEIFGLADNTGTHAAEASASPGTTADPAARPQMLARLYPAESGEKVIAWRPFFSGSTVIGQVPCRNGVLEFLSEDGNGSGIARPSIVSWDTRTGRARIRPLTFADGTEPSSDDFDYAVQDLRGNQLHWVNGDGRVFSTDIATGRTTTRFNTGLATGVHDMQTLYAFSAGRLHTVSTIREAKGNLTYTVFDRTGGEIVRRVDIPIPHTEISISYLSLSHMAARPDA